ncbi:another transcription unit protein-like isoform X2 [Panicum virgatum]|uniref:Uncharacterized protein n=1 Tax=Panicum virgatum TaxID=38727 RepID=A0A8T0XSN1_PANVG|nr:another transcription unit protein-like isoform X2 [Panicum virgatum]KAG2662045.1 hypothetical protein PVAP13_1KG517380 [Panicum virgatum]
MPRGLGSGGEEAVDLWAMAAELERQFAGYKQRLAERGGKAARERDGDAAAAAYYDGTGGVGVYEAAEADEAGGRGGGGGGSSDVRGRMYEAYVRRRDERLREGWRARMERKEAEVKALWAQLELTGRAGAGAERAPGGDPTPTTTDGGAAAGDERETEWNDDDKRRSSDTALAPRRITGKKHARTRSFSSSITTNRNRSDVGRRRALSQEPPPSEPHASAEGRKDNRVRPAGGASTATTSGTARPKTSLRRKNSVRGHVSATPAGPKLPRSLPRRASSGGLEALSREAVLPIADAPASVQSSSSECVAHGETPNVSQPRPFIVEDDSGGGCAADERRDASPESDRGEVVEAASDGKPEAKNADVEELCEEKVDASPDELGNPIPSGEITSDSETEPSYVYINKDNAEEQAMTVPEPLKLAGSSDAALDSDTRTNEENGEGMPAPADATAAEIATTNAEEAPARESSDESLFSVRSGLMSARPSCSSRDQSIERLLEADAVLLRKKREERAEKSTPKTPGSAGSRAVSDVVRSPRGAVRGFKKFLSFGKKNRGREVTVIDCPSPSVPSLADDDSTSGGWQSAGSIKPRMGSSDAAFDDRNDTDHGYAVSPRAACSLQSLVAASPAKSELAEIVPQEKSPKAPRSFFSFRSLNCGRG